MLEIVFETGIKFWKLPILFSTDVMNKNLNNINDAGSIQL